MRSISWHRPIPSRKNVIGHIRNAFRNKFWRSKAAVENVWLGEMNFIEPRRCTLHALRACSRHLLLLLRLAHLPVHLLSSGAMQRSRGPGGPSSNPGPQGCPSQMLTAREFSQHLVSSSKTVRPYIPVGARCVGHDEIMWSAVCSVAPHSQFGEGARPHLYMSEPKRPVPERNRLSLTQDALGRLIPNGLVETLGMKAWSADVLVEYSKFQLVFAHCAALMPISDRLSSNLRAAGTKGCLDFSLFLSASWGPWKRPSARVSLLGGEAQQVGCP